MGNAASTPSIPNLESYIARAASTRLGPRSFSSYDVDGVDVPIVDRSLGYIFTGNCLFAPGLSASRRKCVPYGVSTETYRDTPRTVFGPRYKVWFVTRVTRRDYSSGVEAFLYICH